jgi:dihydrofolate reductase
MKIVDSKVPLSLIVAMTREGVIGINNQLPWHLPKDLKYFKEVTLGSPVVMGRKTFDSIGRPLPGRKNLVISREPQKITSPAEGFASLETALIRAASLSPKEIFIIGGGSIFQESLPLADRLYITWIERPYPGDVYFPPINFKGFQEFSRFSRSSPEAHHYSVYQRQI